MQIFSYLCPKFCKNMRKLYTLLTATLFLLTFCSESIFATNATPAPRRLSAKEHLYIIDLPEGGWAAYTTDPRARHTVLAYTTEGRFCYDSLPEPMQLWLQDYELQLSDTTGTAAMAAARRVAPSAESMAARVIEEVTATNAAAISPLTKSQWIQSAPYNQLCPSLHDTICLVGCVATAWSQLSYFHKYPASANFNYLYIWAKGATTLSGTVNSTYNYAIMDKSVGTGAEAATKTAVATLCRDWGYAAQMNYGPKSSGAVPGTACTAAIDKFGFDQTMLTHFHNYYDDDDWDAILLTELQAGRPILYSGWTTAGGGHSFICDGYDGSGKFHFNYGWGGSGYYCVTTAMQSGYNRSQQIQTNIRPAHGNAYNGMVACSTGDLTGTVSTSTLSKNKVTFYFADSVRIALHHATAFYYTICCENCSTGVKTYGDVVTSTRAAVGDRYLNFAPGKANVSMPAGTTLAAGTYRCYPVYRTSTSAAWQKMYFRKKHISNLKLTVAADGTRTLGGVMPTKLQFSKTSITLTIGDTLTTHPTIFPVTFKPTSTTVKYTSSNTSVATVGTYTGKVTAKTAGTTTITATTTDGSNVSATYTLTVNMPPVGSTFEVGNFTYQVLRFIDGTHGEVQVKSAKCAATLTIPATVTYGITYSVVSISDGLLLTCGGTVTSLTIPASITKIGQYAFYNTTALKYLYYYAESAADFGTNNMIFAKSGATDGMQVTIGSKVSRLPANLFNPSGNISNRPVINKLLLSAKYPPEVGTNALNFVSDTTPVRYECPESFYQYQQSSAWAPYTNASYRLEKCSDMPPVPVTDIEEQQTDRQPAARKILRDGHLYILVGDREYSIL